ncbi:hypothetical protein WMF20_24325 [Sorangium sp. So ce834]|uniref:hypothetical protein n=1 Tax=Sorangium sp. So ce834 TaxID=3133321 RepID=UPI003F5E973D
MAMAALTAGCAAGEAGADEADMDEPEAVEVEETSQALYGFLNPRSCGLGGGNWGGGNWGGGNWGGGNWGGGNWGPGWGGGNWGGGSCGGGNWGPSWPTFPPKPCFGNSWRPFNSYNPFNSGNFSPGYGFGNCNNRW